MASPLVTINGESQIDGVNVGGGDPITIQLADTSGVKRWSLRCISTDETQNSDDINGGVTINQVTRTASLTAPTPTDGATLIFESIINDQKDVNGNLIPEWKTTFGIFIPTNSGRRVLATGMRNEGSSQYGWIVPLNETIRSISSGVQAIQEGSFISVDASDPANPIVSVDTSIPTAPNTIVQRNSDGEIVGSMFRGGIRMNGSTDFVLKDAPQLTTFISCHDANPRYDLKLGGTHMAFFNGTPREKLSITGSDPDMTKLMALYNWLKSAGLFAEV